MIKPNSLVFLLEIQRKDLQYAIKNTAEKYNELYLGGIFRLVARCCLNEFRKGQINGEITDWMLLEVHSLNEFHKEQINNEITNWMLIEESKRDLQMENIIVQNGT